MAPPGNPVFLYPRRARDIFEAQRELSSTLHPCQPPSFPEESSAVSSEIHPVSARRW